MCWIISRSFIEAKPRWKQSIGAEPESRSTIVYWHEKEEGKDNDKDIQWS
jgi:hypothetical protein